MEKNAQTQTTLELFVLIFHTMMHTLSPHQLRHDVSQLFEHAGVSTQEAAEVAILPFFEAAGGADSERTFVKQIIQKHMETEKQDIFNTNAESAESDALPF